MKEILKKGVDISEHNGDVDIENLKQNGVGFVIIRCGYGSDYSHQDDTQFENNVIKCIRCAMPWGVYLYSYAKNTTMAESEAQHTLRLLKDKPSPDYGVWYDIEDDVLPTGNDLAQMCKTYCRIIEDAGYETGIYTYLSWLREESRLGGYTNDAELSKYGLWYAQYNNEITYAYPERIDIWQYSESAIIEGKTYDVNYAYTKYPKTSPISPKKELNKPVRVYRYFEDIPDWGKETVRYYIDGGLIQGVGTEQDGRQILDLSEDIIRLFVIIKRKEEQ